MSRAGRSARRARLIAAGQWQHAASWSPSSMLTRLADDDIDAQDRARRERLAAEHDEWVTAVGIIGWQAERDRRRLKRVTQIRQANRSRH